MKRVLFALFVGLFFSGLTPSAVADDWNQWQGANRNGEWNESGVISSIPADGLKEIWRTPIAAGFSGPAVAGDRVFVTDYVLKEIIAKMTPAGYEELGRAKLVEPTSENWGRKIVWSHPAFANKCVFARNDKEIVCYSLAE